MKSNAYAVTDNHVIVAKGSKRAMMRKRADLAKAAFEQDKGPSNFDSRFHVYLTITGKIGDDMNKPFPE